MKLQGKVVIAQGGGPTAVINQSLAGVVLEARKFAQVDRIYGAQYGVQGIVNEDFVDLSQETVQNLEKVAQSPSAALFSTRDKPDEKYCKEIFKALKAHDVRYFFYVGGNDSADTVRIVNEEAKLAGYDFRAIHIPKTIDNDLVLNDHTPGFGSAARFVASAFAGVNLDNRALPGVYIGIVMGRHAGFLTAASVMGQKYPDDGPHLVYLPERPFKEEQFLSDVKRVYDQHGRCVVAVSEGIVNEKGVPVITTLTQSTETDAHGNVQLSGTGMLGDLLGDLVKEKLKIKRVRSDTFGYLQRSFLGCVSDVDQREAREAAEKAVHFALWDNLDGSVSIQRVGSYAVDYRLQKLEDVARKTKLMPPEYINQQGNGVTDEFKKYLLPLVGSGFELSHRLRAPSVAKLLD
ncbi:MAG: 6-phosphofructokinase [Candidatus Cloacimonetes bacterium]|nr:6-phosphofructokinase [Candidatus Cloacimonadota bacterium]